MFVNSFLEFFDFGGFGFFGFGGGWCNRRAARAVKLLT